MSELIRKVKDRFRDLIQTHGSSKTKQRLWDTEFADGRWDCLDTTTDDCVYSRLEKWVKGGCILDLGCGSGSTANELNECSYSNYTGVDISEVAIVKARERTLENGRGHKCRFLQGDVVNYKPGQKADVILLRDSIYYIKRPQIGAVLKRYSKWLTKDGVFIVRIWNGRGKLREFVDIIGKNFDVLEEYRHEESGAVVLVFRCHAEPGEV
jgi:SAM-dependent methyltransferase